MSLFLLERAAEVFRVRKHRDTAPAAVNTRVSTCISAIRKK